MKLKAGWMLTELSDEYIAVPTGESAEGFRGIVRLNETGKDVFQGLLDGLTEAQIAEKLLERYDGIDRQGAEMAVKRVVDLLKKEGLLTE
ncbi:MAG: PqqD family protein [Oscillospiraceae bacterium]|nr:PqqD family protein [Oscillospiraceae bacterium]